MKRRLNLQKSEDKRVRALSSIKIAVPSNQSAAQNHPITDGFKVPMDYSVEDQMSRLMQQQLKE